MTGPLDRELARRRGQRKLDAMKRRTGQLRQQVAAIAVIGFVLLWTVVFVQMATGNDPALGTGVTSRSAVKKKPAPDPERRSFQATAPPPSQEDDAESAPVEEPEAEEPETNEAASVEAEQIEIEQQEAEARELEELETVTTGQS
jgi:cytoskeletal protein RodZ